MRLEPRSIYAPVIIKNVRVPLSHHMCLRVASVALNTFDVATVEHQLVGRAGVADTVEYYFGQVIVCNQLIEQLIDGGALGRRLGSGCEHQIVVRIIITRKCFQFLYIFLSLNQHFCYGTWKKDFPHTHLCCRLFQNENRMTTGKNSGEFHCVCNSTTIRYEHKLYYFITDVIFGDLYEKMLIFEEI